MALELGRDAERTVRVGPQGRVVIPVNIRRELDVPEGTELSARVVDGAIVLEPAAAVIARLRKPFSKIPNTRRLSDELIRERREEVAREAAE